MYRRRPSALPEIRVLAPSLERGLDDYWPLDSELPGFELPDSPSLVQSLKIYQSHDDFTRSESSRYYFENTFRSDTAQMHSNK